MSELTGDCEIDCQKACAYPGQFSECETPAPQRDPHERQLAKDEAR